jgi:hypothetical protein
MTTSVRFTPEIEERLNILAKETGRAKSFYIKQMVEDNISDRRLFWRTTLERIPLWRTNPHQRICERRAWLGRLTILIRTKELKKLDKAAARNPRLFGEIALDPTKAGKVPGTQLSRWRYARNLPHNKGEVTVPFCALGIAAKCLMSKKR